MLVPRKLKVFQAQIGFYDTVVAVPSQAAALRAWDTHQNLFASGGAKPATDDQAMAAARAHPQVPLRRPIGSNAPFALEPAGLPRVPDAPKRKSPYPPPKPAAKLPPPDRSELDATQAALDALDDRRKHQEADDRRAMDELQSNQAAAQKAYVQARHEAGALIKAAREAYRRAGGNL